jgi:hypothetical protein
MDWAVAMGSGCRGGKGEVCLVGGLVGGPVGGLMGGVVFDNFFWHALAFATPTHATSDMRACTEYMRDCLFPYSQEILHLLEYGDNSTVLGMTEGGLGDKVSPFSLKV